MTPHAQSLDQERRVFAVDMRNHGASSHHESMTYVNMADDVLGFLADKAGFVFRPVFPRACGDTETLGLVAHEAFRCEIRRRCLIVFSCPSVPCFSQPSLGGRRSVRMAHLAAVLGVLFFPCHGSSSNKTQLWLVSS